MPNESGFATDQSGDKSPQSRSVIEKNLFDTLLREHYIADAPLPK
jgi:hypothetical protein